MFLLLKKIPILLTEYRDELTRGSTQLRYNVTSVNLLAVNAAPFPARSSEAVSVSAECEAFSMRLTLWESVELRLISSSTHSIDCIYNNTVQADCQHLTLLAVKLSEQLFHIAVRGVVRFGFRSALLHRSLLHGTLPHGTLPHGALLHRSLLRGSAFRFDDRLGLGLDDRLWLGLNDRLWLGLNDGLGLGLNDGLGLGFNNRLGLFFLSRFRFLLIEQLFHETAGIRGVNLR